MNGILNVLKPTGMTSHDVVSYIRSKLKTKKVGHTGTLDPNAAGVLPICLGKATKITQYLIEKRKKYRCELTLGKETDTQDKYGKVIKESEIKVNENEIRRVFKNFLGEIEQIPPMHSALKHKGRKLYELARVGKKVDIKPRKIKVYNLDIISIKDNKKILFDVECSKGTYIRTLCKDIGRQLGPYGYMSFLLRTRVDKFDLLNAYTIEEINDYVNNNQIDDIILPIDYPLDNYKIITIKKRNKKIITNGGRVFLGKKHDVMKLYNKMAKYRIYCEGRFLGIGKIVELGDAWFVKMEKLLV
ncbi:tRNA pseudouridine(55) synthase TruB [Caldisalinibacter kiritimatiensis]|uniref:tRNA pseudouridine synthase B n=1 Tax=Caldisalinibacter kiritimatiensis TaxID=1304284 RepID=R1CPN1_9FIRM|nr:tRNA pseudouridine(55) synthase TruB [Caldisalinibacter kiritimatiensis]EOD00626.1 tRNA pseudouridine synthase B [Caldisalinibacter kiritimatiensis]